MFLRGRVRDCSVKRLPPPVRRLTLARNQERTAPVARPLPRPLLLVLAVLLALPFATAAAPRTATAADVVDEIHLGYGSDPATSMWVYWRGAPLTVDYGPTTDYGSSVT